MGKKEDWEEIERYIDNKDMSKINRYKMDINKEYSKLADKRKIKNKR